MSKNTRLFLGSVALIGVLYLVVFYTKYDPEQYAFFPKCPFKYLTGYACAGCGSQRAVHHLLEGNYVQSFQYNPLLMLSIPYIIGGYMFGFFLNPTAWVLRWRRRLYGTKAIYVILCVILLFWIGRNM